MDANRLPDFGKIFFSIFLLILISFNLQAAYIYVVNSESRTLSRIDTESGVVQNAFASLGLVPNKVIVSEDYLWCVNSGDNAVQKINRATGAPLANILVENGCNPWDACLSGNYIYVTGLFTNKVYKININTHAVEGSVTVGISPEALCAYNGKLYVTNTGGYQNNYANSSVSVIDLNTFQVIQTISVLSNPQFITEHNGLLHVSCTGNWTTVTGAVSVIDPAIDANTGNLTLGGALGSIWIGNDNIALVGDGNGLYFFRYDATDFTVLNDNTDPLPNGGSVIAGNNNLVAILQPNWGNNGKVRLLHPDLSFWQEFTIGLAPMDMKVWQTGSANNDTAQTPDPQVSVGPNPFFEKTEIKFTLPQRSQVNLSIYNSKGQLVRTLTEGKYSKGEHTLIWNGKTYSGLQVANGIYLYRLQGADFSLTKKLMLMR